MDVAIAIVLTLLVILYVAFEYSALRAKYDKLFSWYSQIATTNPNNVPSIGPMRIVLSYERPWLSRLMTRPITQETAEFLLRLAQQEEIRAEYMVFGPGTIMYPTNSIPALINFCQNEPAWNSANNPLGPGPGPGPAPGAGNIPFNSDLVCGYRRQNNIASSGCGTETEGDLSLETLWMHGYEEYVRQRFTSGASSVLGEWNYMFGQNAAAPPLNTGDACSVSSFLSGGIQAGIGAAGVGAMLGAPEGGIGAIPGAIIGFIGGAASSLLGKAKCF